MVRSDWALAREARLVRGVATAGVGLVVFLPLAAVFLVGTFLVVAFLASVFLGGAFLLAVFLLAAFLAAALVMAVLAVADLGVVRGFLVAFLEGEADLDFAAMGTVVGRVRQSPKRLRSDAIKWVR